MAKAASAGVLLALAVAALLVALSGCGGDSDAEPASAPRPPAATSPSRSETATNPSNPGSAESKSKDASAGSAKQGTRVVIPKGAPEPGLTPEQRANATIADIALESPAVRPLAGGAGQLPSAYTCEGKDSWPALSWRGVPPETTELALFVMGLKPVEGKLFFSWAVAGIDPELDGLDAGRLPPGAVVGRNGFGRNGYSICPQPGQSETYVFVLFALPKRLSVRPGFDPHALRKRVLDVSGNAGLLAASYTRRG